MSCDFNEISETLHLAKLYIENLNSLKSEICSVEKQVITTSNETEKSIKKIFTNLKECLFQTIESRERELLKKAEEVRIEGLQPLKQCEKVIEENIQSTKNLIEEGSKISQNEQEKIIKFLEKATILGTLPEVPESKVVPYISFHHEPTTEKELICLCSSFGEVYRTAPIQIKNITPKPGGLLIEWQQCYENDERVKDIQEFKLQRAYGDVVKQKNLAVNFIDCYVDNEKGLHSSSFLGADTQYLLRDIQISQPYSFRVCCKFDGTTEWSPWSVAQVRSTSIRWFSWKHVDGVVLSNEGKIVTSQDGMCKAGNVVFSDGSQVSLTDSVEFTVLEADPRSELILALCTEEIKEHRYLKDNTEDAFMVNSDGKISVAGVEKSTVLSKFTKGLKVYKF